MFEKEAEEYTENPKSAWKQGMTCVGSVRQAFKDGAELGYNKVNEELEEKISVLLSCENCPENKDGLICQKEYENKCLAQKIQYIKELKEENAKLKKQLRMSNQVYNDNLDYSHHIEGQLTKAKEIIEELYNIIPASMSEYAKEPMEHARKFMTEE